MIMNARSCLSPRLPHSNNADKPRVCFSVKFIYQLRGVAMKTQIEVLATTAHGSDQRCFCPKRALAGKSTRSRPQQDPSLPDGPAKGSETGNSKGVPARGTTSANPGGAGTTG